LEGGLNDFTTVKGINRSRRNSEDDLLICCNFIKLKMKNNWIKKFNYSAVFMTPLAHTKKNLSKEILRSNKIENKNRKPVSKKKYISKKLFNCCVAFLKNRKKILLLHNAK